jgi:hypothetical protein
MSKLYIFGIGGTGSRVLKSLTLLLAAGVKCNDTIIPIIIDRDVANGDLERTRDIIKKYIQINSYVPKPNEANKNLFFSTKIELLNDKLELQLKDDTSKFSEYVDRDGMSKSNKALTNALFPEETLDMDMTVGFQGNPNVGSVVLNQFENAEIFTDFANDFDEGDKVFIVSSIFGGTGASGFPLLLKTLNKANPTMAKWGLIQKAPKGAISVLPYFEVEKDITGKSLVKSSTFIDKTKAALAYYKSLDKQIDSLYYIADKERSSFEHNAGGKNQSNKANFIELASALSIIDFVNNTAQNRDKNDKAKITKTIYKEFGIIPSKQVDANGNERINNCKEFSFADMNMTNKIIRTPMIQFFVFRKYLKEVFEEECKNQPYAHGCFTNDFLKSKNIQPLIEIQDEFFAWLKEMIWLEVDKTKQNRSFAPLNILAHNSDVFEFIADKQNAKKGDFFYRGWSWMDNELNKQTGEIKSVKKSLTKEGQFVELFYRTTESFVKNIVDNTDN